MDINGINEVFVAQLEELNLEADKGENNNWLSPVFIEQYELKLKNNIRKARTWSVINSMIQIPILIYVFLNSRHSSTLFGIENRYLIPLLIAMMLAFNFMAARPQKLMSNYEKQLLLIDTYKKMTAYLK